MERELHKEELRDVMFGRGCVMAGNVASRVVLAGRHERGRTITRARSRWE